MASRSMTSEPGLVMVSVKTARVLSSMAALISSGLLALTNFTLMPSAGRMSLNWVYVPP